MSEAMPRTCWICDLPIHLTGIEITGRIAAGHTSVAHRTCRQTLGELELDLLRAEGAAPGPSRVGSGAA